MDLLPLQEPRIYAGGMMTAPEHWQIANGSVSIYSHRAPDKETENEDVAALIPLGERGALLLVADGMGGARAGGQAAEIAVRTLVHALRRPPGDGTSARVAILNGFEAANHAVMALGAGAATTLAIVEFRRNRVRAYHVGD